MTKTISAASAVHIPVFTEKRICRCSIRLVLHYSRKTIIRISSAAILLLLDK